MNSDSNKDNLMKTKPRVTVINFVRKTKHLWLITTDEVTPYEYHISTNALSLAEAEKIFKTCVFATVNPASVIYIGKVFTMEPEEKTI